MNHKYLVLFKRSKRWFLNFVLWSLVLSLTMVTGCSLNKVQMSNDFNTYLSYNTKFEKNVSVVLPSKKELEDSKVEYYTFYDNSDAYFQKGLLCLVIKYTNDDFLNEIQRIEDLLKTKSIGMGGKFYYNEILYDSFQYESLEPDTGYSALAYHISSDSNTISYIVLSCEHLTYMDVGLTLSHFPQMENQIIPYT